MEGREYLWYAIAADDTLEQGDIVLDCPVFVPPDNLDVDSLADSGSADSLSEVPFDFKPANLIVLSQTCDLVKGREKVQDVLLCPLYKQSDFKEGEELAKPKGWENARKGSFPAYHVINACELPACKAEPSVVYFGQVFSHPVSFMRNLVDQRAERIRLLPPYREHLSQAFARFFMRVGLPVDIPAFK